MRQRFKAEREDRLDRLIAGGTKLSRNRARALIEQGGVRVDGAVANAPWRIVPAGAVVELRNVAPTADAPALPERFRDPWLLVVDKPAGLPSQPAPGGGRTHVYGILSGQHRYVGLHHRLDTPASGLLLLTLDPAANAAISQDFQAHRIHRRYLAAVLGDPGEAGEWSEPLDGEVALTRWRRLGSSEGVSVLLVGLETGRTHQIRRHAAGAGAPLLGDRRYGGAAGRLATRLALHAVGLAFFHPVREDGMVVVGPLPDDISARFSSAGLPEDWASTVESELRVALLASAGTADARHRGSKGRSA